MKDGKIIAHTKRSQNLFIFDFATPEKAMKISHKIDIPKQIYQTMALRRQGRATHLVSKNRRIKIWHHQLGYASDARVIKAATLVNGINL